MVPPYTHDESHIYKQFEPTSDSKNAWVTAGGRGFYLKREGVLLNQAIIQAALHHGYARNCQPVMTPFFMRQDIMAECAQLEQFDEELYKVSGEEYSFCEAMTLQ